MAYLERVNYEKEIHSKGDEQSRKEKSTTDSVGYSGILRMEICEAGRVEQLQFQGKSVKMYSGEEKGDLGRTLSARIHEKKTKYRACLQDKNEVEKHPMHG